MHIGHLLVIVVIILSGISGHLGEWWGYPMMILFSVVLLAWVFGGVGGGGGQDPASRPGNDHFSSLQRGRLHGKYGSGYTEQTPFENNEEWVDYCKAALAEEAERRGVKVSRKWLEHNARYYADQGMKGRIK